MRRLRAGRKCLRLASLAATLLTLATGCSSGGSTPSYKIKRRTFLVSLAEAKPKMQAVFEQTESSDESFKDKWSVAQQNLKEAGDLAHYKQDYDLLIEANLDMSDAARCRQALLLITPPKRRTFGNCAAIYAPRLSNLFDRIQTERDRLEAGT